MAVSAELRCHGSRHVMLNLKQYLKRCRNGPPFTAGKTNREYSFILEMTVIHLV